MKRRLFLVITVATVCSSLAGEPGVAGRRLEVHSTNDVYWWAGVVEHGFRMPLAGDYRADLGVENYGNQTQPLLLSTHGDVIWSDEALSIQFLHGDLEVESKGAPLHQDRAGDSLRDAFLFASRHYFPPSGQIPCELLFSAPQYNTWIELMREQSQSGVLNYAQGIIDHGFPPGVLMIDDNWQQDYGQWDFKRDKFPDPKAMVRHLHKCGFKIMLWICPFVNTNCTCYPELAGGNFLLKDHSGAVALVKWWDGQSALLDCSNPQALAWFRGQLDRLQTLYGIDGFKFDAGDSPFYQDTVGFQPVSPNTQSELYGQIGLHYPLNEYRAMWKMGGQPLAERLRDKEHTWADLEKLIPNMLSAGLMGYPFSCPDMIGGGEYKSFQEGSTVDQDLVVRSAQCHALMPMMQFSVAPWRVLDPSHLRAVLKAVRIRQQHKDYILRLARQAALTGEPIVRSLEYAFPHQGYATIQNEFLLGDQILVAPVLGKGACQRDVTLPPGAWEAGDGSRYVGPAKVYLSVDYDQLCYFRKVK